MVGPKAFLWIRIAAGTMVQMAGSGVVFRVVGLVGCVGFVGCVAAAIPADGLGGTNFMKRKDPSGESGAEQNKGAGPSAFRTDGDFAIGKSGKRLPEFSTVGAEQGDINARDQWSL
jgi:hypothetical protein